MALMQPLLADSEAYPVHDIRLPMTHPTFADWND